jgi:hypothetical protein
VQVDVHPDTRVQGIIEQVQETSVLQDLDRVRPIYNRPVFVALNELT